MNEKKTVTSGSDMTLDDIYFVLFRRKWIIFNLFLMGILAAYALWCIDPPEYKSEAELSLRVLEPVPAAAPGPNWTLNEPTENSIRTEVEILQSLDLAQQVVDALTPARIMIGVPYGDDDDAAYVVKRGLTVEPALGSSLIHITFQHPSKGIVQPALNQLIARATKTAAYDLPHDFVSIIQSPTPPLRNWSKKTIKLAAGLVAGGLAAGLALAFLVERILNRSVKRPCEIETNLGLPLFISIPAAKKMRRSLWLGEVVPPWNHEHPLRRFFEGLRDRLIVHFKVRNLSHKPKLVAVTSCGHGAGVSSIAAGLAATLSETGDGNVLLVQNSGERGATQQFHKGELECSLEEVLETEKKCTLVTANIYTITEEAKGEILSGSIPGKLSALMPKLKASEYDYIIFDLPPVSETSATARLSGMMDMVLLVIESEKTHRDVIKRVIKLLAISEVIVNTVLNKTRNYVPFGLCQEFLYDA